GPRGSIAIALISCRDAVGRRRRGQAERLEQREVEEHVQVRDSALGGQREDLDLERAVDAVVATHVHPEGRLSVRPGGNEDLVAGPLRRAVVANDAADVLRARRPRQERRHLHDRVLGEHLDDRVHVVVLERLGVTVEQVTLVLRGRLGDGVLAETRLLQLGTGALQDTVDRRRGGLEQLGDLGGLPLQDVAQDQDRTLSGGQVLQRREDRKSTRL